MWSGSPKCTPGYWKWVNAINELVKPLLVRSTDTIYQTFIIQLPFNTTLIYALHYPNQLLNVNLSSGTEAMFPFD